MGWGPEQGAERHEAAGDDHGEPQGVSQEPDHGDEGYDVEDGPIVGEKSHQLI